MMTVKEMIAKVRQTIHDAKSIEYSDAELISYLDDGNRIMRRTAMSIYPEVLVSNMIGRNVELIENADGSIERKVIDKVVSEQPFTKIIRVLLDGVQLEPISASEVIRFKETGQTMFYYLTGFNTVNFFPAPSAEHEYRIDYIADMKLLDLKEDASPYPLVLDDILIEYAVLRSAISDEFNMQKESSLLSTIISQIEDVLRNMSPVKTQVKGYWDGGYSSRNRRW